MKAKRRRLLAFLMTAVLIFSLQGNVFAAETTMETAEETESIAENKEAENATKEENLQTGEAEPSVPEKTEITEESGAAVPETSEITEESTTDVPEISEEQAPDEEAAAEAQTDEGNLLSTEEAAADDGINTWEELKTALAAGGEVVLGGNVEIAEAETVKIKNTVVLELNGYAITRPAVVNKPLFQIRDGGSLTVNDVKGTGAVNTTYPFQLMSKYYIQSGSGDRYLQQLIECHGGDAWRIGCCSSRQYIRDPRETKCSCGYHRRDDFVSNQPACNVCERGSGRGDPIKYQRRRDRK